MRVRHFIWGTVLGAMTAALPAFAQQASAAQETDAAPSEEGVAPGATEEELQLDPVAPTEDADVDSAAVDVDGAAPNDTGAVDRAPGSEESATGEAEAEEPKVPEPAVSTAVKQEDETWAERTLDESIERYKRPVDRLLEQTIGSASRPVGFDWRKSWFMLGVTSSELIERNNYGSFRLGIMGRKAFGDVVVEGAVNNVTVITTSSSRALALTPYLQAGRKERFEIDVNVSYPLAEGVVTPLFDFFPPMELVLQATAAGRYLIYPRAIAGNRDWGNIDTYTNTQTWIDLGGSLASPTLTELDQDVLDPYVPAGMLQDPARIHALLGFTFDVYMQPGLFLTTRALVAIPVLAAVTQTQLGFWPELSVSLGYAF